MTTVSLTPTTRTEATGALTLESAATYTVHTRYERGDGRFGDKLHITVRHGDRVVGAGDLVAAAAENGPFETDWWCSALVVDGFPWEVSGRRGSGVLEFRAGRVPLPARAEWAA